MKGRNRLPLGGESSPYENAANLGLSHGVSLPSSRRGQVLHTLAAHAPGRRATLRDGCYAVTITLTQPYSQLKLRSAPFTDDEAHLHLAVQAVALK